MSSKAPIYDREWVKKKPTKKKINVKDLKKINLEEALIKILSSHDHSNKRWITDQYDQMVMCDTVQRSGSDAAIIRIHNKDKAIAVSVIHQQIIVNHILSQEASRLFVKIGEI